MRQKFRFLDLATLCFVAIFAFTTSCNKEDVIIDETNTNLIDDELVEDEPDENTFGKATIGKAPCKSSGTNPRSSVTNNFNNRHYFYSDLGFNQSADVNTTGVSKTREIDDRTCTYNYSQTVTAGRTYGRYRLKANSNDRDDLQPRIERASKTINTTGAGTHVTISGTVRIFRVGFKSDNLPVTDVNDGSGSYIIQAKGKHTGGGGSPDPAIALILVKPSRWVNGKQTKFKYYLEIVTKRGGSGNSGRKIVDLGLEVDRGAPVNVTMRNEFANVRGVKKHRVKVTLNGNTKTFVIPETSTQKGTQVKIRFGAYRCKGGEADIRWRQGVSQTSRAVS